METKEKEPRTDVRADTPPPPERPLPEAAAVSVKKKGPPPAVRLIGLVVLAVAIVAILIWGVRALAYATTHETTDDAKIDADTVTITSKIGERVARVLVDTNQQVRKGQTVIVLDDTDEQARYSQALAALQAQRATALAAQQTVALTSATVQAQTEQGRGGIDTAKSNVQSAASQAAAADQQIAVSVDAVVQAQAQQRAAQAAVPGTREGLNRARLDYDRTASLVASGDVARAQLDAARASREAAASVYQQSLDQVAAARSAVDQARSRVAAQRTTAQAARSVVGVQRGSLTSAQGRLAENASPYRVAAQQAQAAAAQAQVTSLQAQLRTSRDQLKYTHIVSPIDGFVGQKSVDLGQQVAPGTPLMTIVPTNHTYITANFKETQIGKMHAGQPVDIKIDAYKGVAFTGRVAAIGPASQNTFALVPPQNASGNFVKVTQRIPVRVTVDDTPKTRDYALRPGMSVVASVRTK